MREKHSLNINIGAKDRLNIEEKIQGVIKGVVLEDLTDFEKRIDEDKKPYMREVINSLKEEDKNQNILGFFTLENSLVGIAYFLNDSERSIYLSRLMTDPDFRNKGVASAMLEELKMRYDTIRTMPVPLGTDYEKPGYMKRLKRFYIKRGFEEGKQWKRYRS